MLSLPLLSWVRVPSALFETLLEENILMLLSPLMDGRLKFPDNVQK